MTRSIIVGMGLWRNNKDRSNQRGQVAILFALVFTFMFVLFAFVVDFGNIVNAKINLQNAVDQAAYAGAAWEARIMNELAQVNYHMRQDVKELGMRVWVTHLRHNRDYPRGSAFINGNGSPPQVEPFICQQAQGYVSLSGVVYQSTTNICRNASPTTGGFRPSSFRRSSRLLTLSTLPSTHRFARFRLNQTKNAAQLLMIIWNWRVICLRFTRTDPDSTCSKSSPLPVL